MKASPFFPVTISCLLLCFSSCQNRYKNAPTPTESPEPKSFPTAGITSANSFQVARSEYNENFVTRYGLLYLSTSDEPFSGRILTIDLGESGEFVYSDEQWKGGRKDGKSTKWFTNGVKMYERTYKEGKWHGTVTRWWPNGQKMYVRGYTNGVRHGKEATWRSDGSPLSEPSSFSGRASVDNFNTPTSSTVLPSAVELGTELGEDGLPPPSSPENWEDTILNNSSDSSLNFETVNEPSQILDFEESTSGSKRSDSAEIGLPNSNDNDQLIGLPELSVESDEELPDLPIFDGTGGEDELPGMPAFPDLSEESMPIELPLSDGEADGLPELPEPSAESDEELPDLPVFDGVGGDDDLPGLPPLPGGAGDDSLPPLPTDDGGLDDLPPLPPLP